ncbi:MAG: PspA/IM30 family protein [Nitrosomonas sp.]|nr:PspA/IM30 family protein [Nitrosomonas sp.]
MPLIKSLFTTLYSRIDHVVNRIENHDAVIEATINKTCCASAQAKVHLEKVRKDGQKLSQQLKTLIENAEKWKQRAKDYAEKDEATAISCLKQRQKCIRQMQSLEASRVQHQKIEAQLLDDIDKLDQRLNMIIRQRNLMRARQSAADAMCITQGIDLHQAHEVDELFDRWEIKISTSEMMTKEFDSMDVMEKTFLYESKHFL